MSQVSAFKSSSTLRQENSKIIIAETYALKQLLKQQPFYNIYEGIDIQESKFVHIYLAPVKLKLLQNTSSFKFSKKIKESLRNKFSPTVLWSGVHKISNTVYNTEIHEKYGPSFKSMFSYIKDPISEKDFLMLMYQLVNFR